MKYLHLIRYKNLIVLASMQLTFRFGFLKLQQCDLALANFQFVLLVLATVFIAAGGYIINAIFDVDTDFENGKKVLIGTEISEKSAYNLYSFVTFLGVVIGFYLSNVILRPNFAVLFVLMATLLYFYSTTLKPLPLIGNVVVAFLVSFSILIIGIFDLYPATDAINKPQMQVIFSILVDYAIMAFIINLIREIIKDLEDIKGDHAQDMKTLAIVLGASKTRLIGGGLVVLAITFILLYVNNYVMVNHLYFAAIYVLIFVVAPLVYLFIQLISAHEKKQFHQLSSVLKFIMVSGIGSILVITQNILHHV